MPLTLKELKERIINEWDEVTILEALHIDAEMLVERFENEIEANIVQLCEEFPLDETTQQDQA